MVYSIQYMRAIAAIMVVIHHSAWKSEQYSSGSFSWFNVGAAGVDLFFIISGYIMCHTVTRRSGGVNRFIIARVKRIVPIYWLLTTMALVVYLLMPDKVNSSGGHTNILASYLLFPSSDKYLIQTGWTLSYEFYFYLVFSVSLFFKNFYKYLVPVAAIVALVLLGDFIDNKSYTVTFVTNPILLEFCFGILAYYLIQQIRSNWYWGIGIIVLSVILIGFVNNLNFEFSRIESSYLRVLLFGGPSLLFFIGMVMCEIKLHEYRSSPLSILFKAIGDSSYSLYLFHPFSLVVTSLFLYKFGFVKHGGLFVVILVGVSTISGYFCYVFLEKPLVLFLKKYTTPESNRIV